MEGGRLTAVTIAGTRRAYALRAQEYTDKLGSIEATAQADQELIRGWAVGLSGPILDVGCGPGHWTGWLHDQGVEIGGIDPVPEFIDTARQRHPRATFGLGRAEHLAAADASLVGVLAWYSLIHCEPDQIGRAFDEFARVIGPGGGLCVGFFEGATLAPFDHAVTTAYFWPVPLLTRTIERSGFTVVESHQRTDPGHRPHAAIIARRTSQLPAPR
jgi:ubiquinone/menaquinone biosynthesis C-methylase UbiE